MHSLVQNHPILLFDLDGTLVDSVQDLQVALNVGLVAHGFEPVSLVQVRLWVGRGAKNLTENALQAQSDPVAINCVDLVLADFMAHYKNNLCVHTCVLDGVTVFLSAMQAAGKRMAVVTNKPEAPAKALIKSLELDGFFELVVGGDTCAFKKPDPAPILFALSQLGATAADAVMFGDSKYDVQAAKNAQIPCVAMAHGYNQNENIVIHNPDLVVTTMVELLA